ncbi:EAL domain-containing protein [Terasakiella sp. SH-1]|uniref:sensor domain-containing protein n=1 Tax=Terasakiella sp. SH-1 TaxID=2560057 RepID=UPI0010733A01|nr:EAL domain-containing protein [Terasakiella sp. SH-1]
MIAAPSEHGQSKKRLYLRSFAALVFGLSLTGLLSYYVLQLQFEQGQKRREVLSNEYVQAFAAELKKSSNLLVPIAGQFFVEAEQPEKEDIRAALQRVKPLLAGLTLQDGYRHLAWAPLWMEREEGLYDDIVTLNALDQQHTGDFIWDHQAKWQSSIAKPEIQDSVVFGLDVVEEQGTAYLVVGQPFFQKASMLHKSGSGTLQPEGYLLGWLDLSRIMRKSWDGFRAPNNLIYLKLEGKQGQDVYIAYQSGLVERTDGHNLHEAASFRQHVSFGTAGFHMELSLVALQDKDQGVLHDLHWIVLLVGVGTTLLWCVLLAFMGRHKHERDASRNSLESYNLQLEQEAKQRRMIEGVLRMNEARWHYVVDNLPIALFALDGQGVFTLGEGRGLAALGMDSETIEGQTAFDVFKGHPDILNCCRECLSGEERRAIFAINRHWIEMRFSPVLKAPDEYDGLICVAIDVTEEQYTQQNLDKANLHLRSLLDNMPVGVVFVRDGVIQWCSSQLEAMFGFGRGQLVGRSPEVFYSDPSSFQDALLYSRPKLQENQVVELSPLLRRQEGERFHGKLIGRVIDPKNYQAGSLWVVQDLTKTIAEEKQRRLSKTVFDNVMEGVMVSDAQNRIVFVNQAFQSITGYQEEEILGHNPSLLSSGKHDHEFYQAMWGCLETDGRWSGEIWNRRKNGESYLEWLTITAHKNGEGEIEEYVAVFSDITIHRENQEQLSYQANYDHLTGLPNRRLLSDRFQQAAAMADREEKPFALVYMDVDNFKFFNESLGHGTGDVILKEVARRLDHVVRSADTIARVSGDEFILLLLGAGDEAAASRAVTNLFHALKAPFKLSGLQQEVSLSASSGIALYPSDGKDLSELIRKADAALYHAKEHERGSFMFFTEEMNVRAQERVRLENRLRHALEEDQFSMHYQPKVNAKTGEIIGAEALIRWEDPEHGLIGPDKFIPLAEETGLILPIGEWVFRTVCSQIRKWKETGVPVVNVAVNLSGRQFSKPDLAQELLSIMAEEGVEPHMLEIEITESFIASSHAAMTQSLNALSDKGVKLSIDDFGTGYSSLNYLHHFPLDIMKIDRSFINNIEDGKGETSEKLAKAVIAIAKSMDLEIVGEGVENNQQLEFLRQNGCDYIQGFYFSKPLAAAEFEKLLLRGTAL